jgi:hypothetical protein
MLSFSASNRATKAHSADCSLEDWPSFLENCPGGTMRPLFRASLPERISAFSRTPLGLAVVCICWVLFLLALVFAFTLLTTAETPRRAYAANSMGASPSEKSLDGWMARRLYCYPPQPCDAWSPFSEDAPFNLRFETQPEEVTYTL